MPFPLAHPAAVLPLRRYCPQRFSFPALVIGSLSPDLGYWSGPLQLGVFSHHFLAGSFGFCLPMGLLLMLLFYLVRRPVIQHLPARHRQIFEPLCRRPSGSLFVIVVSLLIGAWTHILLDSITHEDGWIVERPPILDTNMAAGGHQIRVCDLLYAVCTFAGVACVALSYLNWLESAAKAPGWTLPGFKWVSTLVFAGLTLALSCASHGESPALGLVSTGVLTAMLVAVFLTAAGWALPNAGPHIRKFECGREGGTA
jgi:hypothetical protein